MAERSERVDKKTKYLIGIGSSAGGLEALSKLLPYLPGTLNATYIVAQHLDPGHKSLLGELLARTTDAPIETAADGAELQAGYIYITPPGSNISLSEGKIALSPASKIGPKPSVDMLFSSLAEEAGEKAIGVILSGTGTDGTKGVRALKESGGLVIAQDEESAKYNGMPRSATDTGLVDIVSEPEKIGQILSDIANNSLVTLEAPMHKSELTLYNRILNVLLNQTGCDFSDYKINTIKRRIQRRMNVNFINVLEEYAELLERSSEEASSLFTDILISVTAFFRDTKNFEELAEVIKKLVEKRRNEGEIRVWVPGCATGEEAYSIAMLFELTFRELNVELPIQIFATDLDNDALSQARRGVFSENEVKDIPEAMRDTFFLRREGIYFISKSIREKVVFAKQDIIRDPPFSKLDLISCRNLLIYFNAKLQSRIIPMFNFVLRDEGYLFLGKSETIGQFENYFRPVEKGSRLYLRLTPAPDTPMPIFNRSEVVGHSDRVGHGSASSDLPKRVALDEVYKGAIQESHMPSGVVLNSDLEVKYIFGTMDQFLSFPLGKMENSILKLLKEDIRIDVRAMLHKCKREDQVASRILKRKSGAKIQAVLAQASQVPVPGSKNLVCLSFVELPWGDEDSEGASQLNGNDPRVLELERELNATKEDLQTTIEELETTNEELQSTNEELQSANEELQSANEELQTANEELQSTNEELATVNQELQVKTSELSQVNVDLESILQYTGLPLLVLDNRFRLMRFTPSAAEMLKLQASDVGQIVTATNIALYVQDLRTSLLRVLDEEEEMIEDFKLDEHSYDMKIVPYFSEKERVVGIILLFNKRI